MHAWALPCVSAIVKNAARKNLTWVFLWMCAFIFLKSVIAGRRVGLCFISLRKFQNFFQSSCIILYSCQHFPKLLKKEDHSGSLWGRWTRRKSPDQADDRQRGISNVLQHDDRGWTSTSQVTKLLFKEKNYNAAWTWSSVSVPNNPKPRPGHQTELRDRKLHSCFKQ